MALRNQPYLPLYVQDFLTDEKLMVCSASANGVYIRLMCIMHKSEDYGTVLLKQNFKQTSKQVSNFALQLVKFLPYDLPVIEHALEELLSEKVLFLEGDFLIQKRMVKDGDISDKRAKSGGKGGKSTQQKIKIPTKNFAKANNKANTEIENEDENESKIDFNEGGLGETKVDNSQFLNRALETHSWITTVAMQSKTTEEIVKQKLSEFNLHLQNTFDQKNNQKDFASHFVNWLISKNSSHNGKQAHTGSQSDFIDNR